MPPAVSLSGPPASGARPKRRSKWPYFIAFGLLLAAIAGGLARYKSAHAHRGQAVTTEKAVIRTITQVVTATGKIQPEIEVKISSEVYGEIVELPFRDGARVKKGQLIVKIKPDLYQAAVDQQTAGVASARGAAVDSAARVEKAQANLEEYENLHRLKLASDADYITYKTAFDAAKADYVSAQANVQVAEGLLGQARDTLSKTMIYSPMDGVVTARYSEVGEKVVAQSSFTGTVIMDVSDLSSMEVQINVNENDIPKVKLGDHTLISVDAYPDRKFNGVVKEIASSAESSGATSSGSSAQANGTSTDEVTNFLVKIRIADHDVQFRPGMSATADIQTQTDPDVVAVPIQSVTVRDASGLSTDEIERRKNREAALSSSNNVKAASGREEARRGRDLLQRVVFIRNGDKVRLQPVETGIADDAFIEVKRGVKPGDEIVSGSYAAVSRKLKDGSSVYIEAAKPETSN